MRIIASACAIMLAATASFVAIDRGVFAADHLDPPARTDPDVDLSPDKAADIADVYAWHTADNLIIAVTFAGPQASTLPASFDRDLLYTINISNDSVPFTAEHSVDIRFGQNGSAYGVRFAGVPGTTAPIVGPVETDLRQGNVIVRAGLFDDPFFFDLQGFRQTRSTGNLSFVSTRNFFAGQNLTAVVLQFPRSAVENGDEPIRIWATSARFGGAEMMRSTAASAVAFAALLILAGCGGSGGSGGSTTSTTPTAPAPVVNSQPPARPGANFNVVRCLTQQVVPGRTVADLVVPDTLAIDLKSPSGFPNGRRLEDPVIDVTLAAIFLDLTRHPADTFAKLPLNPAANDVPFRPGFPYLAPAQGSPPLSPTNGSDFNFRTDPVSAFVRVDRMGMPAVATALIGSSAKTKYNDADPIEDAQLKFYGDITETLAGFINALSDDFQQRGLSTCATAN